MQQIVRAFCSIVQNATKMAILSIAHWVMQGTCLACIALQLVKCDSTGITALAVSVGIKPTIAFCMIQSRQDLKNLIKDQ